MRLLAIFILCLSSAWTKEIGLSSTNKRGSRIIGGEVARAGQFPFAAAITVRTSNSQHFCGGALITNEWILTSAQCIEGAVEATIRLGSNSLTGTDPNRVTVASSHFVVNPAYDPLTLQNDIGLIRLRLPVELTDYIQVLRVSPGNLPNSATPTAIGWGQTSDDDPELSSELQFVALAVVPNDECRLTYGNQITNEMLCVDGNYNEGGCLGDSGSPLVVRLIGGQFLQHVGVFSFFSQNGCESTDPSGYTRTSPYVEWITNVTLPDS